MLRFTVATLLAIAVSLPTIAKEINISGSTSVARVMDVLAEEYNKTHPGRLRCCFRALVRVLVSPWSIKE